MPQDCNHYNNGFDQDTSQETDCLLIIIVLSENICNDQNIFTTKSF
jgi:hypothetical protein